MCRGSRFYVSSLVEYNMKPELLWFKHENNAHQHPKFEALMGMDGFAAYGRFWVLNEIICQQEQAILDISKKVNKLSLARKLGYSEQELDAFLNFLADPDIRLIHYENSRITTDRTQEILTYFTKRRTKDRARTAMGASVSKSKEIQNSHNQDEDCESRENPGNENDEIGNENSETGNGNDETGNGFSSLDTGIKFFQEPAKFFETPAKFYKTPKNFSGNENDETGNGNIETGNGFSQKEKENKKEDEEGEKERVRELQISNPWEITPLNPEVKNLTREVMKLWYNGLFKIKGMIIRPGNDDESLLTASLARLDFNRDSAISAVNEYWSNWQEYWFAVMRGDMKKPRDQRRPQFSFKQFCGSIDQLVKSTNSEPSESRIAKVHVSEMF